MKKILIRLLVTVLFLGSMLPIAIQTAQARVSVDKRRLAASKKKKLKYTLKKGLLKDLYSNYGKINKRYKGKLYAEHVSHGEYYAFVEKLGISYIFDTYDEELNYELKNSSPCIKLEGGAKSFFSGLKKKTSLSSLVKDLKKQATNVTYELKEGDITAYYVSEYYAEIRFRLAKGFEGDEFRITVALDEGDNVLPDALTWVSKKR